MTTHYCHNCGYDSLLRDGVYCGWCLDFFYGNRRLPRDGDRKPTVIEQLYAKLDAMDSEPDAA